MFSLSSKRIQTSFKFMCLNLKHIKTSEHKYRRIGPAGRILLRKFNIHENELPNSHIVSKADVLDYIKNKQDKHVTPIQNKPKLTETPVINVKDESITNTINYMEFKNKLPHSYYSCCTKVDNLLKQIKEINEKHKKNIRLEDFIVKIIATLASRNQIFRQVYDLKSGTPLQLGNEFSVYLQTFDRKFTSEVFTYTNPHKVSISQIESVKHNVNTKEENKSKGNTTVGIPGPLFRVYNYSEVGIKMIDELIVPPALMSFTIGKPMQEITENEDGQITMSNLLTIKMTGVSSFIPEENLCELLSDVARIIENPLQLAL